MKHLILTVVLGLAPAVAMATPVVTLNPKIITQDASLTLGEVFIGAGDKADIEVATIKRVGDRISLDSSALRMFATKNGLQWDNASGKRRVMAERAMVRGPGAKQDVQNISIPALRHPVRKGKVITMGDLNWINFPENMLPQTYYKSADALIGLEARHNLRPGLPITNAEVQLTPVIKTNDLVNVVYQAPSLSITLRCKALEHGRKGEVIRFENLASKRVVEALVQSDGVALIQAPAKPVILARQ